MLTPNKFLAKYGLTARQSKIYLDLAAKPESTVVATGKRTKYPRSTIYLELERLMGMGLVISKKVGKSTLYKITDPKVMEHSLREESEKLSFLNKNLSDFNKQLESLKEAEENGEQRTINIYRGKAGIKQLLWNILTANTRLVVGFSPGRLESITDREFAEKWRGEFRERKMHNKIILNNPTPLTWSEIPGFLEENVEAKSLDKSKIKFERELLIYDDVLTICSLKEDKDQYGIEIRDRLLVQSYKQIFEFIWEHVAEPITT
jgi:sugar-specific transcriptional regulator TrmB